jgi:hypothetical protein
VPVFAANSISRPGVIQGARLSYLGALPARRRAGVIQGARLSAYGMRGMRGLGAIINPSGVILEDTSNPPPAPTTPGLPAGYDPNTGIVPMDTSSPTAGVPPPVTFGPPAAPQSGAPLSVGTYLTYTVNYALQGLSNFFTSNDQAISQAGQMLAGVGLVVVNTALPASFNPFTNNSAVLTLQVQSPGLTLQSAKGLCDNAIVSGVGASIISSNLVIGQPNPILTWFEQNWMLAAAGVLGVLILPKILGDLL